MTQKTSFILPWKKMQWPSAGFEQSSI